MRLWIELLASGLIVGGLYALIAMGLNLQYGLMRILNVAHGEFLMLGAYVAFWGQALSGASPLLFVPLAFAGLTLLGIAVHRLGFARLSRLPGGVEAFEARSLLVAFGVMFILQNAALLAWGGDLRGYQYLADPVSLGPYQVAGNKLVAVAVALAIALLLMALLKATMLGKAVRALMQSPVGAELVGIDVKRLHALVFGIGVGLAGAAGALLSMIYDIAPAMGEPYTIVALIVITLGGLGSIGGSLLAGLSLGVIETVGTHLTNPSFRMLLSYGVFMAVLILRPNGLFRS